MTPRKNCSNPKPPAPATLPGTRAATKSHAKLRPLPVAAAITASLFLLLPTAVACNSASDDAAPSTSKITQPPEPAASTPTDQNAQNEQNPNPQLTFSDVLAEVAAGAKLYDVREPDEYAEGHFAEAENYSVQLLASGQMPEVDAGTKVFVYCRSGGRSATAAGILTQAGFTNVIDLGGLPDVEAIGGQLVR